MKKFFDNKFYFVFCFCLVYCFLNFFLFRNLYFSNYIIITYGFTPFNIYTENYLLWENIKKIYIFSTFLFSILISNSFYNLFITKILNVKIKHKPKIENSILIKNSTTSFSLYLGKNSENNNDIFITKKGLYQNMLITGTIGTGKTSSAMYPFAKQFISSNEQFGMLILDVKGNFHSKIKEYTSEFNRENDLIIIELGKNIKYNPLDKPNLKPLVLANRLKTILTLLSSGNTDPYWLDKAEQVLAECIKLCRLYNNGYVTFEEIHNLITIPEYLFEKTKDLKQKFLTNSFTNCEIYDLSSSLDFFQKEFSSLDSKVLSILKSEITRITGCFVSDLEVLNTFCPKKNEQTFLGFKQVIENGKIVVLNMNIHEYKNLSKIIAAYLKLDFQTEVMMCISSENPIKPTIFMCDEYHEYVTSTDADFFAQSREAKCINIVSTQSYTSLINSLKDKSTVSVIIQNLINKLWFRTDDIYTIEETQKQLGKEDKIKFSKNISENSKETDFNYFTNSLNSKNSSISETITKSIQTDYIYDTNFFTQHLETFTCMSFLSTGTSIIQPCKITLQPYFKEEVYNEKI